MGNPNPSMVASPAFTAFLALCLTPAARGQAASGVYATCHDYNPAAVGWDMAAVSASCATIDAGMPLKWRQRYGWAAFCGPAGPTGGESCGRCLRVTNAATGAGETVRIVDQCHNGGLELEEAVFRSLDPDGRGFAAGHLTVDYSFVDCGD